ncbi:hypothetical protein FWH58_02555 [Candidatus Saccharibacteria bacterium]|nr:hypothetical protein [Candidatus Saccharibacteria bacterium]
MLLQEFNGQQRGESDQRSSWRPTVDMPLAPDKRSQLFEVYTDDFAPLDAKTGYRQQFSLKPSSSLYSDYDQKRLTALSTNTELAIEQFNTEIDGLVNEVLDTLESLRPSLVCTTVCGMYLVSNMIPNSTEPLQNALNKHLEGLLIGDIENLPNVLDALAAAVECVSQEAGLIYGTQVGVVIRAISLACQDNSLILDKIEKYYINTDPREGVSIGDTAPVSAEEDTPDDENEEEDDNNSGDDETESSSPQSLEQSCADIKQEYLDQVRKFNKDWTLKPTQIDNWRLRDLMSGLRGKNLDIMDELSALTLTGIIYRLSNLDGNDLLSATETYDGLTDLRQALVNNHVLSSESIEVFDLPGYLRLLRWGQSTPNDPGNEIMWIHIASTIAKYFPSSNGTNQNKTKSEFPGMSTLEHIYDLFGIRKGDNAYLSDEQLRLGAARVGRWSELVDLATFQCPAMEGIVLAVRELEQEKEQAEKEEAKRAAREAEEAEKAATEAKEESAPPGALTEAEEKAMRLVAEALDSASAPGLSGAPTEVTSAPDAKGTPSDGTSEKPESEAVLRNVDPRRDDVMLCIDTAPSATGIRAVTILSVDGKGYYRRLVNFNGVQWVICEHDIIGATYAFRVDVFVGEEKLEKLEATIADTIVERKISVGDVQGLRDKEGVLYLIHSPYWNAEEHFSTLLTIMQEKNDLYGPDKIIQAVYDELNLGKPIALSVL